MMLSCPKSLTALALGEMTKPALGLKCDISLSAIPLELTASFIYFSFIHPLDNIDCILLMKRTSEPIVSGAYLFFVSHPNFSLRLYG